MSLSTQSYLTQIHSALDQINAYRGAVTTVTSKSNVTSCNNHRPFLESIRNDLYHYDEEKKARIIYNIEDYLSSQTTEDPDLTAVLERVLQIIQHFQQANEILVSPTKVPPLSQDRVSSGDLVPSVRRRLFEELSSLENV